jgi:hypothetical protein
MPTELVFDDIRNYFWYTIEKTRPTYDPAHESYQQFMVRDQQWIDGLASIPVQDTINALCDVMEGAHFITSENMPHQLYQRLSKEVSADGLRQWELDRDTPITALERVWREQYWNAYWEAVDDLQGDERRLADRRF